MTARTISPPRLIASVVVLIACCVAGCASSSETRGFKPRLSRFFLEAPGVEGVPLILPQSGVRLVVNTKPVLTEGDILNVELVQVDLGKCLMFQLTPPAARDFYRLSGAHQGRRVVLAIDGDTLGARRMDGPIVDGVVFVFVELPDEQLPALVQDLKKSCAVLQKEIARKG